jgi:hypothetical protein
MPQYNGVWTVEQQAQALTTQAWVTDPNFNNTTLLLQADTAGNGATNNLFLDSSANNFTITRNGNTTQGSFSPFSQAAGYWGNYFPTSSYFTVPNNAVFNLGSNNFTIECWYYQTANNTGASLISQWQSANDANSSWQLMASDSTNTPQFTFNVTSPVSITSSIATLLNTWNHLAAVRNGGTITLYLNGVSVGSSAVAGSIRSVTNPVGIAARGGSTSDSQFPNGYISNARVVNGTAVYTAAFTPQTTPLTAITNTVLLTSQSNRFVDNSTTASAITIGGTSSVQAFAPFAPALQWTPDVVGGSVYFDGTGDDLILPSSSAFAMGTGQFCLEAWHYPTQNSAGGQILSTRTSGINDAASFSLMQYTGTTYSMYASGNHVLTSMTPFQWNHVIVTRDASNTLRLILNGVLGNYEASYTADITNQILSIGALNNNSENGYGYTTGHRITKGSIPTTYQTSSTTIGATIFTPPTTPVTLTSQGATSGNVSYLSNYTNAGIFDGKMANNLETVGTAQVNTGVVKYGSGSMYFNGSTDYLKFPSNPWQVFGTGDFTIEWWQFINSFTSGYFSIIHIGNVGDTSSAQSQLGLRYESSGTTFRVGFNGTYIDFTGLTTATSVWTHGAVVRTGNILKLYINGIQQGGDKTVTNSVGASSLSGSVGGAFFGGGSGTLYSNNGYLDDLRVTKGVARYFTTFTPPQQALPRQ